jgi:glycosyltransferase involved in cell wall biosynthesis
LSSAHPDLDVRIFFKECVSLANAPVNNEYEVHMILAGVEERIQSNVHIHSVPIIKNSRLKRMWKTVNDVYKKALEIDADIYHLHDPELLRIALKLKRKGKIVIYDAHEDLPRQILGKEYLKFKHSISNLVEKYENSIVKKLDAVVTATPFIRDRFLKVNSNTVDINNFPLLTEIDFLEEVIEKQNKVCFIGNISQIRGIHELVKSFEFVDVKLDLAGKISDDFKRILESENGWKNVNELGYINRQESLKVKSECFAGIVTFLALPNHVNAQPNKIFEYMASGIPVIGSNFPLWKEIIEENNCGICVDPTNPRKIAEAIEFLKDNPEIAKEMGANGKSLVVSKYNWNMEEKKLISLYTDIAKNK